MNHQTNRREYPVHNAWRERCTHDRERNGDLYRDRPLLAAEGSDAESCDEDEDATNEQPCGHCGRKSDGEQTQESANNLLALDSSIVPNVWRGDT